MISAATPNRVSTTIELKGPAYAHVFEPVILMR